MGWGEEVSLITAYTGTVCSFIVHAADRVQDWLYALCDDPDHN